MNKETQAIIWANALSNAMSQRPWTSGEALVDFADIILKQAINKYNSLWK